MTEETIEPTEIEVVEVLADELGDAVTRQIITEDEAIVLAPYDGIGTRTHFTPVFALETDGPVVHLGDIIETDGYDLDVASRVTVTDGDGVALVDATVDCV